MTKELASFGYRRLVLRLEMKVVRDIQLTHVRVLGQIVRLISR